MNTQSFDLPDPHYQPEFYADVPLKRLISWAIDTVIIVLLVVLILPFTAFTGLFFLPLLAFLVNFAYRVICLANGSATLGMRLTAIEFRTRDGARFDVSDALLHTLGYTLSWMFPIAQFVSVIFMASQERGQGLTDMALSSVALNRRAS
ncbi:MAG: RDD family protein [Lentibacter sp.]|uniref:RDD family protein n=1 Tax=Lentibacter sp. TaxID=2024994 RepID=UPI00261C8DB9|nr:RDD family protein [Lentibacter sp.]MDG1289210.1 RDD family protein [Lentibacter sp.]